MFMTLFAKECRQILKSITFYIYVMILVLFYVTQLGDFLVLKEPQKGQESYGEKPSTDPDKIMEAALDSLVRETYTEQYTTYPVGFYKEVFLNNKELQTIYRILEEAVGRPWNELKLNIDQYYERQVQKQEQELGIVFQMDPTGIKPAAGMTYERFEKLMAQTDDLLGGGSSYGPGSINSLAKEEMNYEEALQEYEDIIKTDGVTGAYARLFCDYMGLMAGVLPVFLAMTRVLRDRRSGIQEVIFVRKSSSVKIILTRYLSNLLLGMLPIAVLALFYHLQCVGLGGSLGVRIDHFAFLKYLGGWITPSMMVALSVGFLCTELTGSPVAVLIQGGWWWISVMVQGRPSLYSEFGMDLSPRWNTLGKTVDFYERMPELVKNRIIYTAAAILLLVLTIVVYEQRRKGRLISYGALLRNRKSKLKA